MKQYIKKLWLPVSILALAFWVLGSPLQLSAALLSLLPSLPYGLLVVALVLTVPFRCATLVPVLLGLLPSYWLIQSHLQTSLELAATADLYRLLTISSGLFFVLWLSLPAAVTRWRFGVVGILLLFAIGLFMGFSPWQQWLQLLPKTWLVLYPFTGFVLPWLPTGLFAAAFVLALLRLISARTHSDVAMLMLVVVVCCTYALFYQPFISAWLFSAAAFIACAAVLQSSRDMAFRDELTGLLNRRAFNEHLANLGRRYVIATLDIDHFKQFNDTHGHDVGDDVLKLVASRIARGMRGGSAYRYGGEEFCMVFPGKALAPCIETLEAIREDIAQYPLTIRNQKSRPSSAKDGQRQRRKKVAKAKQVFVTASIGVAERSGTLKQVEQVLKASDKALYRAKKKGRNCVVS